MEREIAVLVVSCDRYDDLWKPFFNCFFKYWPDCPFKVYLGTNHRVLADARVTTISIGDDRSYSENLLAMLEHIPARWVIFWVDDRFVAGPVQTAAVLRLAHRAQELGAACLKLIPEHPLGYAATPDGIGAIPKGTFYRVSLTITLWQKECLAKLLVPGESAWQLEKKGARRSADLGEPFFGLARGSRRQPPIPHVHTLVKGRIIRASLPFLTGEGLLQDLRQRGLESRRSQLYTLVFWKILVWFAPLCDRLIRLRNRRHECA